MRKTSRYKSISKLQFLYGNFFSYKFKDFKLTKWKVIKKKALKKITEKKYFITNFSRKTRYHSFAYYYLDCLRVKRAIYYLFDNLISYNFFKKATKNVILTKSFLLFGILKFFFRLDIILWKTNFFNSGYHAQQAIKMGKISLNNAITFRYDFVKKLDHIFISDWSFKIILKNKKNCQLYGFLAFVEFDYLASSIIVIKNIFELSEEDLNLLLENQIDLLKFKDFLYL